MLVGRNVLYVDGKGNEVAAIITADEGEKLVGLTYFPHGAAPEFVDHVRYSEEKLYNTWHYL